MANFPKPEGYQAFWQAATALPVEKLLQKYPPQTLVGYVKKAIKTLLGRA